MTGAVQIIAMKTWGELGNLLAARTLAAALRDGLAREVHVVEAESLLPRFAAVGERIEQIVKSSGSAQAVHRDYLELMASLREVFPPGLEDGRLTSPLSDEIEPMVHHFRTSRPALVCGMKGVISRVCRAAIQRAGIEAPVVNFVTNEGLLRLDIHRSRTFTTTLVPLERSRRYAIEECGYPPTTVEVVGRLMAAPQLAGLLAEVRTPETREGGPVLPLPSSEDARRVIVFSNRGGEAYLKLLEHVGRRHRSLPLIFIAHNQPALVTAAQNMARELSCPWHVVERASQAEYIAYLQWLAEAPCPVLISKAGPNTMLEAAYFGIPVLLLDSGLPVEKWVAEFVDEHRFGKVCQEVDELVNVLDNWLSGANELAGRRDRARKVAADMLDQEHARARITQAFTRRLASRTDTWTPVPSTPARGRADTHE